MCFPQESHFFFAYQIDLYSGKSNFGSFPLSNFCAVGCDERGLAWGPDITGLLLAVEWGGRVVCTAVTAQEKPRVS